MTTGTICPRCGAFVSGTSHACFIRPGGAESGSAPIVVADPELTTATHRLAAAIEKLTERLA